MAAADQAAASSAFWSEFHGGIADRLKALSADAEKNGDAPAPDAAHSKFLKGLNFNLEFALLKVWRAYSQEEDNGDRKIGKEAALVFYDSLINGCEKEAIASLQDYTKYLLKYYAETDEDVKKKHDEALEKAETDALKEAKTKALSDALSNAKQDSIAKLKKAIEALKAADKDASTEEADKKLTELTTKKEEADKAAEDNKAKATEKAEKAKAEKLEKMSAEEKEKFEKAENTKKEKEEKAAADAASKKEAGEAKLNTALEEAADDVEKVTKAIADAKRDPGKPDVSKAEDKLDDLVTAKADADAKEAARTAAEEKWSSDLNAAIDALINDQTADYKANFLTKQKAGFEKFFDGGNKTGEDYEFARDAMKKVLTVGAGDFENFVQELGFKVVESDAKEALHGALEPEKSEEKKET